MAVEIRVPPLGESVVEATVGRWSKQPGDAVRKDEVLGELPLRYEGRPERASPAEGYAHRHAAEQMRIVRAALSGTPRLEEAEEGLISKRR